MKAEPTHLHGAVTVMGKSTTRHHTVNSYLDNLAADLETFCFFLDTFVKTQFVQIGLGCDIFLESN